MNSDQRIKDHFEEYNLPYTNADDAIDRLLMDHKQHRENNRRMSSAMKKAQDTAIKDANEHIKHLGDEYISVDDLWRMTIQEIVGRLK